MKTRTETLKDIEPKDLYLRIAEFADERANPITVERQPDGRWTVTASVPVDDPGVL